MSGCKQLMVFLTTAQRWCKSKQKYLMPLDWQNIPFMLLAYLAKGISGIDAFIPVQTPYFPPLTVMHKWKSSHFVRKPRTVQTPLKLAHITLSKGLVERAPEPLNGTPQTQPSASTVILHHPALPLLPSHLHNSSQPVTIRTALA